MRRHWLITRTIALVLLTILLMLFMILVGTWSGLAMFAPLGASGPPAHQIASLALDLAMLLLCWGGVAMAFGAACRPGVARPAASLIAFAALLLDYAQKLWPALECVGWLSPFRYFTPFELVMGDPLPVENLLVLGAIATDRIHRGVFHNLAQRHFPLMTGHVELPILRRPGVIRPRRRTESPVIWSRRAGRLLQTRSYIVIDWLRVMHDWLGVNKLTPCSVMISDSAYRISFR